MEVVPVALVRCLRRAQYRLLRALAQLPGSFAVLSLAFQQRRFLPACVLWHGRLHNFSPSQLRPELAIENVLGRRYRYLLSTRRFLLTPLGISKIRATPTWCLYSAAASTLIFLLLYWLCDVKRQTAWASFVKPAGSNTLLTYLLPDLFYAALGTFYLSAALQRGAPGVIKALVFTALMLTLAAILTRLRVRLQL